MVAKASLLPADARTLSEKSSRTDRDLRELRAVRFLENATIGAGGLTISGGGSLNVRLPSGSQMFYLGALTNLAHLDGSPQQAFILRREDGSNCLAMYSFDGVAPQSLSWYDIQGNFLVSEDQTSGQGLARPYIAGDGWFGAVEAPANTTSSATFTTVMTLPWIKQHPRVTAYYLVQASTGATSGEIRLVDDFGTQIGPTVVVGLGGYTYGSITGTLAGAHMFPTYLHWQARVTAGAGTLGVKGLTTYGVQS